MKKGIIYTLATIALMLLSFIFGRFARKDSPREPITIKVDTLLIHDTIRQEAEVIERKVIQKETVPVFRTDTIIRNDTVFVVLPREQITASGKDFRAWISGYKPALDSIDIFQKEKIITRTVQIPEPRWAIGIEAGFNTTFHPEQICGSPYAGAWLSYTLPSARRWSLEAEAGYSGNIVNGTFSGAPYAEFRLNFELFSR